MNGLQEFIEELICDVRRHEHITMHLTKAVEHLNEANRWHETLEALPDHGEPAKPRRNYVRRAPRAYRDEQHRADIEEINADTTMSEAEKAYKRKRANKKLGDRNMSPERMARRAENYLLRREAKRQEKQAALADAVAIGKAWAEAHPEAMAAMPQ